jgi:hypothetical protein
MEHNHQGIKSFFCMGGPVVFLPSSKGDSGSFPSQPAIKPSEGAERLPIENLEEQGFRIGTQIPLPREAR